MSSIPITFTHEGKEYTGDFSQVQGAGSSAMYHLMVDNYYKGCLRISAYDNKWVFDGEFKDLAEAFGLWLHLIPWLKTELEQEGEEFYYHLAENIETVATL